MLKIYRKTLLIMSLSIAINANGQNGNWTFVGPISNNNLTNYEFETAQLNRVIIDPNNSLHLFTGGRSAGLWESTNGGANWQNINTNPNGFNGVLGINFLNSTQIIVGNYHQGYNKGKGGLDVSDRISIYDFQNQTWQSLGALPSGTQNYVIKNVTPYPGNSSILFACTSIGLFRSTDGGLTWTSVPSASSVYIENIVFIPKTSGNSYYCYIAGSNVVGDYGQVPGTPLFMESSDDGLTFTDYSSLVTMGTGQTRGHSMLCVGASYLNGDRDLFILSSETPGVPLGWDDYGWDNPTAGKLFIDKITKNINSLSVTGYAPSPAYGGYGGLRMAIAYDPQNNYVWIGSLLLGRLNLNTNTFNTNIKTSTHNTFGNVHADLHDIKIIDNNGQWEMYIANDGGLVKASIANPNAFLFPYFDRLNNGINVSIVSGFSGSQENPNIYAVSGMDIENTDIYDEIQQKNKYTKALKENDGPLIDEFNDQNIFFDRDSYNNSYQTSENGGQTISSPKGFYLPLAGSSTFEQGNYANQETQTFTRRQFYQDPYRPGRIFHGKKKDGIYQYDFISKTFVCKISPFDIQPNINWGVSPPIGDWGFRGWVYVKGMSFSPQTPNSIHFMTNGSKDGATDPNASPPAIIQYIGNNLNDCWKGHNDAYNNANPQWKNITPDWPNLSSIPNCGGCNNALGNDMYNIDFKDMETSPWNKEVVYVLLYMPNNPMITVLKYDGTAWSNYSNGLPVTEYPFAMTMDHASNDGLYMSTNLGIYYRDASMSSWIPYNDGKPLMSSIQLEVNYKENTVRAGTSGRGIWKSPLNCPSQTNLNLTSPITANFYEANNVTASNVASMLNSPTVLRGTNSVILNPGFQAVATSNLNTYCLAFIHGCSSEGTSPMLYRKTDNFEEIETLKKELVLETVMISPNPSNGIFEISSNEKIEFLEIYDLTGHRIKKIKTHELSEYKLDLSDYTKGIYILKVILDDKEISKKIVIQ